MQRWKIPITRSLLAPTCLYSRGCWVTAARARNLRQKRRASHAPGLGPGLCAAGSQAREDSEHAKFKVNSRETSEATSCCWELPWHFFLLVPIPHGQLLAGWRALYTAAPQHWSQMGQETGKHQDGFCTKTWQPWRERALPKLRSHTKPPKITVLKFHQIDEKLRAIFRMWMLGSSIHQILTISVQVINSTICLK